MFDFAWSEIALIGVVALIAIGPKDLPVAMKAITDMIKKARRMAAEFQTHVDDMVREANLHEVRDQINEIRNFDLKGTIERAVDEDGSLRKTFEEDPLATDYTPPEPVAAGTGEGALAAPAEDGELALAEPPPAETREAEAAPAIAEAPAFIPPEIAAAPEAPAFIPPEVAKAPPSRGLRF